MNKRFLSILLVLMLALLAVVPAFAAEDGEEEDSISPSTAGYYYVYTENGKGLNVRETAGGKVVGSLKYGTKIYCYYRDGGNGWALIDYTYDKPGYGKGTYACYISSRYLRKNKPAAYSGNKKNKNSTVTVTDTFDEVNAEFRSAKKVDPYRIYVNPTRASGWVNMRWAPSLNAELIANYGQNAQLTVLQETTHWLMVEDPNTGDIGYMKKEFTVR